MNKTAYILPLSAVEKAPVRPTRWIETAAFPLGAVIAADRPAIATPMPPPARLRASRTVTPSI